MRYLRARRFTIDRGKPVSGAAALANIHAISGDKPTVKAEKGGAYIIKRLNEMKEDHSLIGDVRKKGLIGIKLVKTNGRRR